MLIAFISTKLVYCSGYVMFKSGIEISVLFMLCDISSGPSMCFINSLLF